MSHRSFSMLPYVKGLLLSCIAVLAPAKSLFVAALVLVGLDTVSGVMAALKRNEKITSAGLRRSVSKGLVYVTAILTGFIGEKYLLEGLLPVSKLVAGAIGFTECVSILENLNTALGVNIFGALINKLSSKNDATPKGE